MWSSAAYLQRCEKLKAAGIHPTAEPGERVARGFADLGYEEFVVLPSGKLLSLFTGEMTKIGAELDEHFFLVPSFERLCQIARELGYDLEPMQYEEQRTFELSAVRDHQRITAKGSVLIEAMIDLVSEALCIA